MPAMGTELNDQKISLFADPRRDTRIQIGKEMILLERIFLRNRKSSELIHGKQINIKMHIEGHRQQWKWHTGRLRGSFPSL